MSELDDARRERELREVLAGRDPGRAPTGLHERVAGIPDTANARSSVARRLSRAAMPVLGLAAAVVLLVFAIPLLRPLQTGLGPGASVTPTATFDPALRGPGLVAAPRVEAEPIIGLVLLVTIGVALATVRRRPRIGFPLIAVAVVLAYAGAQVLMTHAAPGPFWSSGGIGVREGALRLGLSDYPVYITARSGEPFSFGFSVSNDGPLPIRLEGIVLNPDLPEPAAFPTLRAIWRDGAPDGGSTGPAVPFSAMDLAPGQFVVLWLVGTTGECAAGPSFQVDGTTFIGLPAIAVRYSVFGLPRTDRIDGTDPVWHLPFEAVMQPDAQGRCQPQP